MLREAVRYQLLSNLGVHSRKVTRAGRPQRSDFCILEPRSDWNAAHAKTKPFHEDEASGLTEEQFQAATVVVTGAECTMDRLFRHKAPLFPGLRPPTPPQCPCCEDGCDETPSHLFSGNVMPFGTSTNHFWIRLPTSRGPILDLFLFLSGKRLAKTIGFHLKIPAHGNVFLLSHLTAPTLLRG